MNRSTVPNGGSVQNTYNCNSTHTIRVQIVRSIDGQTQVAGPASHSESLPAAPNPSPSVTLVAGASAAGQPGCSAVYCHYLKVTINNMNSGTYGYKCMENGSAYSSGTASFTEGVGKQLSCYDGNDADVYAIVNGVASNHVNPKQDW